MRRLNPESLERKLSKPLFGIRNARFFLRDVHLLLQRVFTLSIHRTNIALARKFLEIIYRILKNKLVFEDFTTFKLNIT